MRMWNWLTVASCLAGVVSCGHRPRPNGDGDGHPRDPEFCRKTYENWPPQRRPGIKQTPGVRDRKLSSAGNASGLFGYVDTASSNVFSVIGGGGDDCPSAGGCGLNGSWLGSGVQFRELHLTAGVPNAQGLVIREFKKGSELLKIDVRGQELFGYRSSGGVVGGTGVIGTELLIDHVVADGKVDRTYRLTITDMPTTYSGHGPDYTQFWAACADNNCVAKPRLYTFKAVSSEGCDVRLCEPGLDDAFAGGLMGTAVIFRGDLYNDDTYAVEAERPNSYDGDVFNIACLGTSISKLHLMRHTSATGHPLPPPPQQAIVLSQRTTMLKLLAADYCGVGVPFTMDGLPLRLAFNNPEYSLNPVAHYNFAPGDTIDAAWTEKGAQCIGTSRVLRIPMANRVTGISGTDAITVRNQIIDVCKKLHVKYPLSPTTIPECTTVTPTAPFAMGNYSASGNPTGP
jgi:hypothetical protein